MTECSARFAAIDRARVVAPPLSAAFVCRIAVAFWTGPIFAWPHLAGQAPRRRFLLQPAASMALDMSNELAYAGDRDDERSDAARWLSPMWVVPRPSAPWRPGPGSRSRWCRWFCRTRRTSPTPKRQAVLKAVAELGYRPDPVARSLAERRTRTVGVVIDDLSNPWYVALLDGLRPVLHEHGLRPLLADGRTEPDAVQALGGPPGGRTRAGRHPVGVGRRPGQRTRQPAYRRSSRALGSRACPPSIWSPTTTTTAASWRRGTCSNWGTGASPTSSARARWVACVGQATRRRSPNPGSSRGASPGTGPRPPDIGSPPSSSARPAGRPRSSRRTTSPRSVCWPPRTTSIFGCPRTSRSWATTTAGSRGCTDCR